MLLETDADIRELQRNQVTLMLLTLCETRCDTASAGSACLQSGPPRPPHLLSAPTPLPTWTPFLPWALNLCTLCFWTLSTVTPSRRVPPRVPCRYNSPHLAFIFMANSLLLLCLPHYIKAGAVLGPTPGCSPMATSGCCINVPQRTLPCVFVE